MTNYIVISIYNNEDILISNLTVMFSLIGGVQIITNIHKFVMFTKY